MCKTEAEKKKTMCTPVADGAHLTFEDCQYTVETTLEGKPVGALTKIMRKPTKTRYLLRNISGEVTHGSVLAIMGPSGAGKTTLLNMLTLEKKGGVPRGKIELNGQPFTRALYNKHCAYVQQEDSLWATFSSRDHLRYAMDLCQPHLNHDEREFKIDKLLEAVGLTESQHVKAGNAFIRGLSSGLKRRLSIAIALAKQPQVLFLDEPTSGIDSASASSMMIFLKEIAVSEGLAIACTIHQPSASVFAGFDKTLILSDGRVAYSGLASDLGAYLLAMGKPLPPAANPAEFVLDLVNKDFTDKTSVMRILDHYDKTRIGGVHKLPVKVKPLSVSAPPAGFFTQVGVLTRRQLGLVIRDPMLYTGRVFMIILATVFFSLVYLKTRRRVQEQALQRFFFTNFIVGVSCNLAISVVFAGNIEFNAIKREVKDGQYSPVAQFVANQLVGLPAMIVLGLAALIPLYLIGDLHWPSFGLALISFAVNLWAFEGMGQFFSLSSNVLLGMMNFMQIWFSAFLFSGLFVRIPEVIWPFRLFCYVLPLGYTSQTFMWAVMKDTPPYTGASRCTDALREDPSSACSLSPNVAFYCENVEPISCFGTTGPEILDSVGVNYAAFSSEDLYAQNVGIVLAIGVLFRLFYVFLMVLKCRNSEEPKALTTANLAAALPEKAPPPSASPEDVVIETSLLKPIAVPPAGKWELSFLNCSYELKVGQSGRKSALPLMNKQAKPLITDISASVASGELLAILGPSGAGKTVLLNMLTLEKGAGQPFGDITLNGEPLTFAAYRKYCAYVPREDTLWATLTARQHIEHAFSLYRPDVAAGPQRDAAVDALLDATGLTSAQHTKAGNALFKGLSGGQKRRLALAIVLVKEPKVLILDEPTSGLDSAAAAAIMKFLRELAHNKNLCVIATIHQPSAAVYSHFSKTLILAKGRTAYYGPAEAMTEHFDSLGHTAHESANPAEFVLDLVCPSSNQAAVVDDILDAWAREPAHIVSPLSSVERATEDVRVAAFSTQLAMLLRRNVLLLARDPMIYSARCFILIVVIAFFGVIYIEQREQNQANVMPRFFYMFWGTVVPAMFGAVNVYAGNIEYNSIKGEIRNGMTTPFAYLLANLLVQLPMMFVMGLCVTVPLFGVGGFPWHNFAQTFLIYSINLWVWECMGQFLSLGRNPIMGMLNYVGIWFMATLFSGLVFRGEDVIWPIRLLYYVLPFKYLFGGMAWAVFTGATYSGAMPCSENCDGRPFTCDGDTSGLQCWGVTGEQILRSGSYLYEVITPTDFYGFNVSMLVAQAVVFKLLSLTLLYIKSMANARAKLVAPQPISKPKAARSVAASA